MQMREIPLGVLNSATKYPSIVSYHEIDPRNGRLLENITMRVDAGDVYVTEKVDGTNARIILFPDGDYVIGSREDLLYAMDDHIPNPSLQIVETLHFFAETLQPVEQPTVYYLEVYGGKNITAASRNYTTTNEAEARLFDVATIPPGVFTWPREKVSKWREDGGQIWCDVADIDKHAAIQGLDTVPMLAQVHAEDMPVSIQDTYDWACGVLPVSGALIDADAAGAPEGVVVRSNARTEIAKIRFKDYRRSLGLGKNSK